MEKVNAATQKTVPMRSAVQMKNLRCIALGRDFLDARPLSNLCEVLGIGNHEGINRMMRMSGVEEAYITGGASDYDKTGALCRVLPLWAGHPYSFALGELLIRGFGIEVFPDDKSLPEIWRKVAEVLFKKNLTLRDLAYSMGLGHMTVLLTPEELMSLAPNRVIPENTEVWLTLTDLTGALWSSSLLPSLNQETAATDMSQRLIGLLNDCRARGCRGVAVDLSNCTIFLRPNPYTPARAVIKLQHGETLTEDERALIVWQSLRLFGGECVRRGWRLMMTGLSSHLIAPICDYLRGCGCLPETWVVTSEGDVALSCGVIPYLPLETQTSYGALSRKLEDMAARMPLGRLGGIYMPLRGAIDFPMVMQSAQVLCRCVTCLGMSGWGTDRVDEQKALLEKILT
ncbi:MAG: hypothetical protein E7661_01330 [Ruminococcaceae bacterium]|nr:hypothetical protein [Oscillospiraceae bacterium]